MYEKRTVREEECRKNIAEQEKTKSKTFLRQKADHKKGYRNSAKLRLKNALGEKAAEQSQAGRYITALSLTRYYRNETILYR